MKVVIFYYGQLAKRSAFSKTILRNIEIISTELIRFLKSITMKTKQILTKISILKTLFLLKFYFKILFFVVFKLYTQLIHISVKFY